LQQGFFWKAENNLAMQAQEYLVESRECSDRWRTEDKAESYRLCQNIRSFLFEGNEPDLLFQLLAAESAAN